MPLSPDDPDYGALPRYQPPYDDRPLPLPFFLFGH
jgi:hypothetical protein